MTRIYGNEQRVAVRKIREELIHKLENIYLTTFDQLQEAGLGEGMVIKITQLLLLSREGAIHPLQQAIEERKTK